MGDSNPGKDFLVLCHYYAFVIKTPLTVRHKPLQYVYISRHKNVVHKCPCTVDAREKFREAKTKWGRKLRSPCARNGSYMILFSALKSTV